MTAREHSRREMRCPGTTPWPTPTLEVRIVRFYQSKSAHSSGSPRGLGKYGGRSPTTVRWASATMVHNQSRLRKATGVGTPHSASPPPGFPGRDKRSGGPRDSGAAPDLAHGQSERLANHGLLNPPGAEALGANPLALGGRARLNADPLKVRAEDPAGNAGGLPAVSSQVLRLTTLSQLVSARGLLPAHVATHSHRTSLTARLTSSATPARTRMVRTGNPFCNRGPISAETPWGPRGFRLRHSLSVGVAGGARESL